MPVAFENICNSILTSVTVLQKFKSLLFHNSITKSEMANAIQN